MSERKSSSAQVEISSGTERPSKSSNNLDQGLAKKLKKLDGRAVSVGNESAECDAGGSVYEASQSGERGIVGSTEGSDGSNGAYQTQEKSGSEGMLSTDKNMNVHTLASSIPVEEANATSTRISTSMAPANVAGKSAGSPNERTDSSAACVASSDGAGLSFEVWVQDERQLKRERRKQANRESARRSRLRKQAENEELMMRYESLNVENMALKSELNQLTEDSKKLKLENAALLEKLNNTQLGQQGEMVPKMEVELALPKSAENLLGQNDSDSVTRNVQRECESHENSNSETKLHQLLESSSRADAVAAS
ncbi:hypothetical protein L1049_005614 [Liquidambar formosana]|uniref:BZIP domain-containing protein n=1 Tax=Liquidambar formosana TaxID=63359 RepID=A0AAP0WSA4_LIQFO